MKRDMNLIRKILLEAEMENLMGSIEGYDEDNLKFHRKLAIDSGLLRGQVMRNTMTGSQIPVNVFVQEITIEGYDFIDSIRDDSMWIKVKEHISKAGSGLTVEAIKVTAKSLFFATL